jgi:UrcA family protein
MTCKTILSALALVAALGSAAGVHAAPANDPDTVSVSVSITGLNPASLAGAQGVLRRIRTAADGLCGGAPDPRDLDRGATYQACMTETVNRAVASLDLPMVSALNAGGSAAIVSASR